jgi:hypothetical protein
MTQPIEVVSILVAASNRRYPRHHHFEHLVSDAIRNPPIRHGVRKPPAHTEHALLFPQQKQAAVGRLVTAATVIFLRQTDGRSKGSSVSSVMAAVAVGRCTSQFVETPICYVNRRLHATVAANFHPDEFSGLMS